MRRSITIGGRSLDSIRSPAFQYNNDGNALAMGDYSVTEHYEDYLSSVLNYHESESPISHKKKYELVVGDVTHTCGEYFEQRPETIVALAYFDLDLYEPTRACLEAIGPHLTKGTVIGFDELNCSEFAGETMALRETLGLQRYPIRRSPHNPLCSYLVVE
jgi:hypothetical protein